MIKRLLVTLLALTLLSGCAALVSTLANVQTAITDTEEVLSVIEASYGAFEAVHPLPAADQAEFQTLMATCYKDLNAAQRTVTDLGQVDQGQYDQAFADFKLDFIALLAYLKAHNITPSAHPRALTPGAAPAAEETFPTPRVIDLKIKS